MSQGTVTRPIRKGKLKEGEEGDTSVLAGATKEKIRAAWFVLDEAVSQRVEDFSVHLLYQQKVMLAVPSSLL